jgi:hypothetical protein
VGCFRGKVFYNLAPVMFLYYFYCIALRILLRLFKLKCKVFLHKKIGASPICPIVFIDKAFRRFKFINRVIVGGAKPMISFELLIA